MTPECENSLGRLRIAVASLSRDQETSETFTSEYLETVLADTETVLDTITTIKQQLCRTVNSLPQEVLLAIFWLAIHTDEPKRKGDGWCGSAGWMSILWVCRWWRYIMFENTEVMAWVYSTHPELYKLASAMAGNQSLRVDSRYFCGRAKQTLDDFIEYTDFYRVGTLIVRNNVSATDLLQPLTAKPWANLRLLEVDQRCVQRVLPVEPFLLIAYQLRTVRLTDYWIPILSQDLRQLSLLFTNSAAVRPTMIGILEYLSTTSLAVTLETLELTNAIAGPAAVPDGVTHIALQALQYLRIHDTAANAIQLLTMIDWDGNAMLTLRVVFSENVVNEVSQLAQTLAGLPITSLRVFWQARKGRGQRLLLRGWTPYMRSFAYAESRVGEPPAVSIDLLFEKLEVHWLDVAVQFARKWSSPGLYLHDITLDVHGSVMRRVPCVSIGNVIDELQYLEGMFPNRDMLRILSDCGNDAHNHDAHIEELSRLAQVMEVPGYHM